MAVYVDPLVDWGAIARARGLRHTVWCHLTADTPDELHAFARRLGLRRSWFQHPDDTRWHYDITAPKREAALRMGALDLTRAEMGRVFLARRIQSKETGR
jgi:Protein of unknown function (DUF4031)